jgi:hypothetical protein
VLLYAIPIVFSKDNIENNIIIDMLIRIVIAYVLEILPSLLQKNKATSDEKINNYSQYAAAYCLIEAKQAKDFIEPSSIVENKITLLEHISRKEIDKDEVKDRLLEEYASMDKGTRILAYKVLLEKFNTKYNNLSDVQKLVLKEYINNISNTIKLREYVNSSYAGIKSELDKLNKKVTDKTIQIKINEVTNLLKPIDKNQNVKDDNVIALLQFHELIEELKNAK